MPLNADKPLVFVFGSNLAGRHGAGAAKTALERYGAIYGRGVGRQGMSYAIPTKDAKLHPLPLPRIRHYVREFLAYARDHSAEIFFVTAIGCGLAGYSPEDIAPMFANAPSNCLLPDSFVKEDELSIKFLPKGQAGE